MKILITGAAGFIGSWLSRRLKEEGIDVIGVDSLSDYYSVAYKKARMAAQGLNDCRILDISDRAAVEALFEREQFTHVFHLAAQAGVRYSVTNPHVYGQSNLVGFLNVLEACRHNDVRHLYYASSSSVYGHAPQPIFRETDRVDHPASLYAATKRANELMAESYAGLYGMSLTGMRLFTVYGPWGRPDMAPMLFAGSIMAGEPIQVFNHGRMARDFTWVGDIVESMCRLLCRTPARAETSTHQTFNIGHGAPTALLDFIDCLEQALGRRVERQWLPMQDGDVERTWADTARLEAAIDYRPTVTLEQGVTRLAEWCRAHPQWLALHRSSSAA